MKTLFILFQYLVPQHLLSRLIGKLANARTPWLKNLLIRRFILRYGVNMQEAAEENPEHYACFNDSSPVNSSPVSALSITARTALSVRQTA